MDTIGRTSIRLDDALAHGTPLDKNPGGDLHSVAQQLDKGILPKDLVLNDQVCVSTAAQKGTRSYLGVLIPAIGIQGLVGGVLGGTLTMGLVSTATKMLPSPTLLGAGVAFGVAMGCAFALDLAQSMKGKVTIDNDGKTTVRTWHRDPSMHEYSAADVKAILTAEGVLGDRIPSAPLPRPGRSSDPGLTKALQPYRDKLKALGAQRRLVADLGQTSAYGKPALNLADANLTRELLEQGKSVYVVDGKTVTDTPHELHTTATNGLQDEMTATSYAYTDRTFDYTLTPLKKPDDLAGVPDDGKGLPDGFLGLYRDETSFTQALIRREESGHRQVSRETDHREMHEEETSQVEGAHLKESPVRSTLDKLVFRSTRPYVITAAIYGGVACGLAGLPPVVGVAAAGAAGHLLGRAALSAGPGSPWPRRIQSTLAAAGAMAGGAMGIYAMLTGGPAAVGQGAFLAGTATGAWGGLMLGALVEKRVSKGQDHLLGEWCFIGGSLLGMATAVTGSPALGAGLAVLGGFGGACTALFTRQ